MEESTPKIGVPLSLDEETELEKNRRQRGFEESEGPTSSSSLSGISPAVPIIMKTLDQASLPKRPLLPDMEETTDNKRAKVTENRKIYIGNLPPSVTEKPLVAHFRPFG